jgi:hypothetical protein
LPGFSPVVQQNFQEATSVTGSEPSSGLAAALMAVKLRGVSASEKSTTPSKSHSDPLSEVVSQLQGGGFKLRPTPYSSRIRGQSTQEVQQDSDPADVTHKPLPPCPSNFSQPVSVVDHSVPKSTSCADRAAPPTVPAKRKALVLPESRSTPPQVPAAKELTSCATLDITQLPGYQPIPPDCPEWKRGLLEKKNAQLISAAMKQLEETRQEEERWKNVPQWKRNLILKKHEEQGASKESTMLAVSHMKHAAVTKKAINDT